ncbi:hypothetical protein ACS0TY_028475 [Phlomoides rotata]
MEGGERNTELNLALRMNGFSSDLLQKLMKRSHNPYGQDEEEERDDEIELSLGLSMNGRFGVDPMRKKLKRSSSIANLVFTADNGSAARHAPPPEFDRYALLSRTRSLPTEVEEEWRRRKEYQSMRRMEAKKKRREKLNILRGIKEKKNCFEDIKSENGNEISSPQGSFGSGSSGLSDAESLPKEGAKQNVESPPSVRLRPQDQGEQEPGSDGDVKSGIQSDPMLDMPYVSTKGDGPDGQRIEGFLYRYKNGEDVKIVCVCHGLFLTPAEFVKHGGGGEVEHPLKHIVVNPFPL